MTSRLPPRSADLWTVGRHTIQARWRLAVRSSTDVEARVIHEWTVDQKATLNVDPAAEIALVVDDALREQVKACIRLERFRAGAADVSGQLIFNQPPMPLAFSLVLRVDQKEYPIQSLAAEVGFVSSCSFGGPVDGAGAEGIKARGAKLVLRPSREAAKQASWSIGKIWGEEVVIDFPGSPQKK